MIKIDNDIRNFSNPKYFGNCKDILKVIKQIYKLKLNLI